MTGKQHLKRVRQMACLICRRFVRTGEPTNAHHVAEGSGKRSDWAAVPLCWTHHQGPLGLHGGHGGSLESFIRRFRPPGDSEYGLLCWLIEDMANGQSEGSD